MIVVDDRCGCFVRADERVARREEVRRAPMAVSHYPRQVPIESHSPQVDRKKIPHRNLCLADECDPSGNWRIVSLTTSNRPGCIPLSLLDGSSPIDWSSLLMEG